MLCRTLLALSALSCLHASASAAPPSAEVKQTPAAALEMLMAGNVRFSSGLCEHRHADTERARETAGSQSPFAIVLSCADSRVPVELVFDRGIGDIFTVRVAGNTSGPFQAGSIEYAVEHLGSSLLVVLGHSSCGAVKAASAGGDAPGNIGAILAPIVPAAEETRRNHPDASEADLVRLAVRANVMRSISDLLRTSPTIARGAENGTLRIVGAVYNLESGTVEWLGGHPNETEIIAKARDGATLAGSSKPHATGSTSTQTQSMPSGRNETHARVGNGH
ncbi:MAG: carbonic anhydrase [Phycisphaeraceae bacterium]|nr:carbonic anhydrase [Phycisphaeraceae bacterium]